ncbi:hypothetical protein AVEN_48905-1 [Araneus ventricosus]|uniref:Uncharacterized protein n=1 Tax=Araneus ventricosus TaxID=182803 RepID=A0A4Y2AJ17_ARAVE|nr:hypothetical protein AVEN_48905-1 [Araneus ventricosus]
MASRRRMEDSERCRTHWSRTVYHRCYSFLRRSSFRHFTIMKTIPNLPNSCPKTCSRSSKGYDSRGRSIYCCCSQAESKIDLHTYDIYGCSGHWKDDICHYRSSKATHEWSVRPGTTSLCSFIRPIQRGPIKVVPTAIRLCLIEATLCSQMSPDLPYNLMIRV